MLIDLLQATGNSHVRPVLTVAYRVHTSHERLPQSRVPTPKEGQYYPI